MFAVEALGYLEDCPCAGIQLLTWKWGVYALLQDLKVSYQLSSHNSKHPKWKPVLFVDSNFPRQWLWKNFHEILNSKFLNWEYSTLITEVVFSFGGINVLPTLLVDFHLRGVLARALVSFTWRSYLFIIFFYVARQRRDETCQDGRAGWANVTAIYGHAILI